jgi:uncharacterized protein YjiS (DUF1127 family)
MRHTEIDFQAIDYRRLYPAQRNAVMRYALERARVERSLAVRNTATALVALVRGGVTAAVQWCRTLALRHRQKKITTALCALDDQVLKDIGVYRCENVSLVELGDTDETRLPRPASRRAA